MAKKTKGINPELESAIAQMLVAVMNDPMASITDKTKVLDRALKLEAIKLKLSDDEWGSGFGMDDEDDKDQTVNLFYLGDKYGRNPSRYYCAQSHLRPLDYNFGVDSLKRNVWLDNVEPTVGTGINSSDIRNIQLPFGKNERKE